MCNVRSVLTFMALVAIIVLAVGGWLAWSVWSPVQPDQPKYVLLRPGYGTRRIARELQAAGAVRSRTAFLVWHYFHRERSLKAGEYLFNSSANVVQVHDRLARGDIYFHTVVIPEGYNMFDIARAVQDAGLGSADEFLKTGQSEVALISDIAPEAQNLEGYLFPATYQFTRAQSMSEIIETMVRQFRQVATEIGLTSDVQRTVTMASIIEKETAVPEERPLVASVYTNRLASRVALQADPSIIYAELLDGTYAGKLHHADMQVRSSYNTYTHPGLPPGPIGNPGRGSLEAAMHPAQTDYFYFVADGNGRHRFAHSLEEHNRNVIAYRRAVNGR
jgi:UPF0755 protein